ncbi:hypothetical protein [Delftia sp. PS-11]|uniref:hypothetical protein n=1 Tax=Delftia sp. PS-11 TaxID=2767222 RepID=UPI0024588658|nr:hypothetical protein [Delftia sp. PS-11]KAJ8744040.1 hypothetical protein H9T68_14560 [Delftia sp. PS-11]
MKTVIATLLIAAPLLATGLGASAAEPAKKPAAKTATKTAVAKKTPAKKASAAPKVAAAAGGAAVAAGAGAAAMASTSQSLSAEELAIAERVHTGRIACELGAFVNVTADASNPGYFNIDGKGFKYHMSPVKTSTGTVRLEDKHAGAVWLQIANKSMLMNQKVGQRLADECMSPDQLQVAEAIKKNPPPSLLDAPRPGQ